MIDHSQEKRKTYILSVHSKAENIASTLDSISEMRSLAATLDFHVVGEQYQVRPHPDPKSYMGTGKLLEIKDEIIDTGKAELVLFDHDLSPNQGYY
ncbi:MAG: GTPase HflX, partial [Proteobacteria bacterium]|nr:GTPase HflX [Pseudomonadota bacterium]